MLSLNDLLAAIHEHLEEGALEDALILCRQALTRAPRSPRVLKTYGASLMATGDMKGASAAFQAALAVDPDDAAASHDLGLTLHALNDLEGARLNFERALTLSPEHAASHEALAGTLADQGDMENAVRHMLVAVELKPDDATTLANFAAILARIGAFFDARNHLERALKLDPANVSIIVPLAQILHETGEHAEAVALVEKAYLKRPRDPMTLSALACGLLQVGDHERASGYVQAALKIMPELISALDALAMLAAHNGEPEKGIAHLAALAKSQKANPFLYLSLAAAMARDGRHAEALTFAAEGLQRRETRSTAYVLMRQSLALLGRFDELVDLARRMDGEPSAPSGPAAGLDACDVIVPLETKPLEAVLMARFLKVAPQSGGKDSALAVYAPDQLAPLLRRIDTGRRVLSLGDTDLARPGAVFIAKYASNERIRDYDPTQFVPYLSADARADDFWHGSLAPFKRPFIGITWAKYPPAPLLQDIAAALGDWPGTIFSLTWDDQRTELEGNRRIIDAGRHLQSLEALIDIIGQMDCVLSPDGLAIHIAGAMGVPGIVLTTPDKPWYWYAQDGRSHWYPSISVMTRPWQQPIADFNARIGGATRRFAESSGN